MNPLGVSDQLRTRHRKAVLFRVLCGTAVGVAIFVLAILLLRLAIDGISGLDLHFLTHFQSRFPEKAGIKAGLAGSLWIVGLTAAISIPLGVSAAIYLEEYARASRLNRLIEVNIANLAGVPSIVYGMLGLTIFVRWLSLDRSLLAGAMTLSLLILPVIIIASREAIRAVPSSMREASFALGASRWQTVRHHVLPSAVPGIVTGVILAISRAIGETAPLILVGALAFVAFTPEGPMDEFTVLPIQIFNWASRPQAEFHQLSATAIIVLLIVLLSMNGVATWIRHSSQKNKPW
jgi:phosphate transport system permease protein